MAVGYRRCALVLLQLRVAAADFVDVVRGAIFVRDFVPAEGAGGEVPGVVVWSS